MSGRRRDSGAMTSNAILSPFRLRGAVALVTGANRGIGRVFARELLARGAATVYAGARRPDLVTDPDVVPVKLDITDPEQVEAARDRCGDVTILINNAGLLHATPLVGNPSLRNAREEMETNFFGTLNTIRAFAPVLAHNGGGAIVNVLSVLSFANLPAWGSYSATKAAAWSLTNSVRDELAEQGTRVLGVHSGLVDTDMAAGIDFPKIAPEAVVTKALDALEAGQIEALVDEYTRTHKAILAEYPNNQSNA
jgi:NAD(P)-dependent dehydrogenase (short-subunit alcohol dehydrogenase family)